MRVPQVEDRWTRAIMTSFEFMTRIAVIDIVAASRKRVFSATFKMVGRCSQISPAKSRDSGSS